jgi:gamma-glutamyltranspeptidase/glutathione hydrolase
MNKARNEHTPGDPYPYDVKAAMEIENSKINIIAKQKDWAIESAIAFMNLHANDTTGTRAVDKEGNMFSATPSGGWFTSSPIIPDLVLFLVLEGRCSI